MSHHHDHAAHTDSAAPSFVRHCDVAVIGGSAAGLAAALQLGRQRRSVIVIDAGEPRNAPAQHMHSFLGRDGTDPAQLLADGRAEVRGYGVEVLSGCAQTVSRDGDEFVVTIVEGTTVRARRIVVATGIADELPAVDGLVNHWGREVFQCPFCHGYEVRDQQLIHLVTHPFGLHPIPLLRQLSDRLTVLIADGIDVAAAEVDALTRAGVEVRVGTAKAVRTHADGGFAGVELVDGSAVSGDAMLIGPRFRPLAEPFAELGLAPTAHPSGAGEVIEVDMMGATGVDGVYAAGSITDPSHQVLMAAAHGSRIGGAVAMSLATEDTQAATRTSGSVSDWDGRYSGEQIWSGNPNGSLVAEAAELPVGRALDVGAGEGGDALWLAEQGWTVTASDISSRALARIEAAARNAGVEVTSLQADANARAPYAREGFDLVTAAYASIPRTPDQRGIRNVIDAVAPGGSVIILNHDIETMRERGHVPFDGEAYVGIDDFVAILEADPAWTVDVNDKRSRPEGSVSAAHHPDDRVLRAHRT